MIQLTENFHQTQLPSGRIRVPKGGIKNSYVSVGAGSVDSRIPLVRFSDSFLKLRQASDRLSSYIEERLRSRIAELRECAAEDGLEICEESESLLVSFVLDNATVMPAVVITDGGNLRAVWRNSSKEQAALIFRAQDEVQFVFFSSENDKISRASGVSPLRDIPNLLKAHSVARLLQK